VINRKEGRKKEGERERERERSERDRLLLYSREKRK
jgi:hypothetical protein